MIRDAGAAGTSSAERAGFCDFGHHRKFAPSEANDFNPAGNAQRRHYCCGNKVWPPRVCSKHTDRGAHHGNVDVLTGNEQWREEEWWKPGKVEGFRMEKNEA